MKNEVVISTIANQGLHGGKKNHCLTKILSTLQALGAIAHQWLNGCNCAVTAAMKK